MKNNLRSAWRASVIVIIFVCVFVFPLIAAAQAGNEAGPKPYGSYHSGDIDSVSLSGGHLQFTIPLASYPQRGGKLGLSFAVRYHNWVWNQTADCQPGRACIYTWANDYDDSGSTGGGQL